MNDRYKELDWGGHFEEGGYNEYVFYETKNSKRQEVAPDDFIKYVQQLQQELQELRQFKVKVITALYSAQYSWEELWCELTEGNLE